MRMNQVPGKTLLPSPSPPPPLPLALTVTHARTTEVRRHDHFHSFHPNHFVLSHHLEDTITTATNQVAFESRLCNVSIDLAPPDHAPQTRLGRQWQPCLTRRALPCSRPSRRTWIGLGFSPLRDNQLLAVPHCDSIDIGWRSLRVLSSFRRTRGWSTTMAHGQIHWLAPASATGALVAALLLSTGHHLFYRSLHGTPVSEEAHFAFEISRQQINIAIGTAFAFLTKASMVVAISITFVQLFWYTVQARSAEAVPTLQRIDALYAVLDNGFEMFNFRSWLLNPLLMIVAGLAWYVKAASSHTVFQTLMRTGWCPSLLSSLPQRCRSARRESCQRQSLRYRSLMWISEAQAISRRCRLPGSRERRTTQALSPFTSIMTARATTFSGLPMP